MITTITTPITTPLQDAAPAMIAALEAVAARLAAYGYISAEADFYLVRQVSDAIAAAKVSA
jgi:hypothetical protein